jgi:hypothetical protein
MPAATREADTREATACSYCCDPIPAGAPRFHDSDGEHVDCERCHQIDVDHDALVAPFIAAFADLKARALAQGLTEDDVEWAAHKAGIEW